MGSRLTEIVVDCHDPAAQAAFWAAVLGYEVVHSDDHWVEIAPWEHEAADLVEQVRRAPGVPTLVFVTVPEGKTAGPSMLYDWNRLSISCRTVLRTAARREASFR